MFYELTSQHMLLGMAHSHSQQARFPLHELSTRWRRPGGQGSCARLQWQQHVHSMGTAWAAYPAGLPSAA